MSNNHIFIYCTHLHAAVHAVLRPRLCSFVHNSGKWAKNSVFLAILCDFFVINQMHCFVHSVLYFIAIFSFLIDSALELAVHHALAQRKALFLFENLWRITAGQNHNNQSPYLPIQKCLKVFSTTFRSRSEFSAARSSIDKYYWHTIYSTNQTNKPLRYQ